MTDDALHAEALELDREICRLVRGRRQDKARIADRLAWMQLRGLFKPLGFEDLAHYARARGLARSRRHARELVHIVERLERLPVMSAAFRAGELDWTKVRVAVRAARPESDARWTQDVRMKTRAALIAQAALELGEPARETVEIRFAVTPEQRLRVERAIRERRSAAGGELTRGEVLALLCDERLAAVAGAAPAEAVAPPPAPAALPPHGSAGALVETPVAACAVPATAFAAAERAAEVTDLRAEPARGSPAQARPLVRPDRTSDPGRTDGLPTRADVDVIGPDLDRDRTLAHDPELTACWWRNHEALPGGRPSIGCAAPPPDHFLLCDGTELAPALLPPRCAREPRPEDRARGANRGTERPRPEEARVQGAREPRRDAERRRAG